MPELPEVETFRRRLLSIVKHKKIIDVDVFYRPIVSNDPNFEKRIINQTIHDILRIGKYLCFKLDDVYMISHLRMEGKYVVNEDIIKHTHVSFKLSDHMVLNYEDSRKFGRFELIDKTLFNLNNFKRLGPEPFELNPYDLYQRLTNKRITIKEALLDQHIIAGLGNIYVNEVLFRARIHPAKLSNMVTRQQCELIVKHAIDVLNEAIKAGGTTIDTFESLGHAGQFQHALYVHDRKNLPCRICGTLIEKKQLKGRGTYYCPHCQKSHVIGLTGGIASGKSTVAGYLKKIGFKVISADELVHQLYQEAHVKKWLKQNFDVIDQNGALQKEKFAQLIFSDKQQREKVNRYIHPQVYLLIEEIKQKLCYHLLFLEIPLLFESKGIDVDKTLVVTASLNHQVERLIKRNNLTQEEAQARIKAQLPLKLKERLADDVIKNNGSLETLYEQVEQYISRYM